MRIAIVSTEGGFWYVRRVRTIEHDRSADEKVYDLLLRAFGALWPPMRQAPWRPISHT
jgi:hypothetical protein